jgi:hypothetical protein
MKVRINEQDGCWIQLLLIGSCIMRIKFSLTGRFISLFLCAQMVFSGCGQSKFQSQGSRAGIVVSPTASGGSSGGVGSLGSQTSESGAHASAVAESGETDTRDVILGSLVSATELATGQVGSPVVDASLTSEVSMPEGAVTGESAGTLVGGTDSESDTSATVTDPPQGTSGSVGGEVDSVSNVAGAGNTNADTNTGETGGSADGQGDSASGGSGIWTWLLIAAGGAAAIAGAAYLLSSGSSSSPCGSGSSNAPIIMADGTEKTVDFGWSTKAHIELTYDYMLNKGRVWIDANNGEPLLSSGVTKVADANILFARGDAVSKKLRVNSSFSTYTYNFGGDVEFWSGGYQYFSRSIDNGSRPEQIVYGSTKSCYGRLVDNSGRLDKWVIAEWQQM